MKASQTSASIEVLDLLHGGTRAKIASFLIEGPEGYVLVETGPHSSLQVLLPALSKRGVEPSQIKDVLVTHIHLDHSGAAGFWAQQGARITVHPLGAKHLVDPSRLIRSAERIWGAEMKKLWGDVLPVPEASLRTVVDEETFEAAGLSFQAFDTPGHANHHHAFLLGPDLFVGDIAGIVHPDLPILELPTPPPEFRLSAWLRSLDRIEQLAPTRIFLTHFGPRDNVNQHIGELRELLLQATDFVKKLHGVELSEVTRRYGAWNDQRLLARGVSPEQLPALRELNPPWFNVSGLSRYFQQTAAKTSGTDSPST